MPTLCVLYPAYGTMSCHEISRYAEAIDGLRIVLADDEPTPSDEDIFDEVVELPPPQSLNEAHGIMRRWCNKRHPDGIFMQSERGLLLGSLLASEFGLRGPTVNAAHLCSNKYLQRLALADAGIGTPKFSLAESGTDVRRLARDFGFPVVLKCVISTMSRLVTLVCKVDEIDNAVARMKDGLARSLDVARLLGFAQTSSVDLGCDPRRHFLVESYLRGDMLETDGLVVGDRPYNFGVTEQIQSQTPRFFIEGYLLPADCSEAPPIEKVSDDVMRAFGLGNTGFSTEMRVQDGKVSIVEVNGRLGWDEALGDLFGIRTHQERIFQMLQLALGIDPEPVRDDTLHAALAYRSCYSNAIIEDLPTAEDLASLDREGLKFGLATHVGAHFIAPPSPDVYPHVAWALATHPESSRAAYGIAREAVDSLPITIRKL